MYLVKSRNLMIVLLILLFLLVPVTIAGDGDYKIPSVVKDVTVNDDGSVHISEKIVYDIEGSVNGVYRNIPLTGRQSVRNISVKTPGYYNTLEVDRNDNSTILRVWLYEDKDKTRKTENARVEVTYDYTIRKGVKVYNDIAEMQYMTWGSEWNSKVDSMESNIHVPGTKNDIEYWNNPGDNVVSSQWTSDDTLTVKLENIDAHTSFEQRILMPKNYIKNTTFAQVIHVDAKQRIEDDQRKYEEEHNKQNIIVTLAWTILGLLLLVPFGIYWFFGREPKIEYNAEYEYDLPSDATPLQVNILINGNVGVITDDAMYATILDLINRKYFKIVVNDRDNTIIRQTGKDMGHLREYELSLIDFLSSFAQDGDISIGYVGRRSHYHQFQRFSAKWYKQAREETSDTWIKQYFDDRGSNLLLYCGIMYWILFILTIIGMEFMLIPAYLTTLALVSMIVFMIGAVLLFIVPNTVPGRWTSEGKEFYDKWKNFEKYIKDYSLIKERPPSSVQVWGKYLVYASALGCADRVTKNMKQYFKSVNIAEDTFTDSNAVSFAYYNGFAHVESSFNTLSESESDSSGSIGSSGSGGFGGGGGGTF